MKIRSLTLYFSFCLAAIAPLAAADDSEHDWQNRLNQAAALNTQAEERETQADAELATQTAACQHKILVNDCLNKARKQHIAAIRQVRQLKIEASALERGVRREQREVREAQISREAAQREKELAGREQQIADEQAGNEAQRQQKLEKKARQAEAGAARRAEQEAAQQRKEAAHAAKLAERRQRAEAQAARRTSEAPPSPATGRQPPP